MKRNLFMFFLLTISITAQTKDYELGSQRLYQQYSGGYYDYSDQLSLNIKVAVWGFVRFPGRYNVPINTTMSDLISFAGGPSDDAHLEDLRLYRVNEASEQEMIKFDFNDIMWEENLRGYKREVPALRAGDILVVPGTPRLYFKDWFSITLSVISTLISLSILILNFTRK